MAKPKYSRAALFAAALGLLLFTGCAKAEPEQSGAAAPIGQEESLPPIIDDTAGTDEIMKIKVSSENAEVIFELNNSSASKSFYEQLPITVSVENYSTNEKIFFLAEKLDVSDVWEGSCPTGSIAYFSPWNNVAMYYGDAPEYRGLYPMGSAVEGAEKIGELSGSVTVTAYTD